MGEAVNKVNPLPDDSEGFRQLRHRWSAKKGEDFRCLRRGCNADQPWRRDEPCTRELRTGFYGHTHGGGIGPFERKRPGKTILAPTGKASVFNPALRTELENPNPRNRNSRKKRRIRNNKARWMAASYGGAPVSKNLARRLVESFKDSPLGQAFKKIVEKEKT